MDRKKLDRLLKERGMSLAKLASQSRISRQSLYTMLRGRPIYNTPFMKMIDCLKVDPDGITSDEPSSDYFLKSSPMKVRKAVVALQAFCHDHSASLFLFGSQVNGSARAGSDWDFGIYFHGKDHDRELRLLKQRLQEQVFPYRMDVINMGRAPQWFQRSIHSEAMLLEGRWPSAWKEVA